MVQDVRAGFTWGEVHIAPLLDEELEDSSTPRNSNFGPDTRMVIPFQNENLCAYLEDGNGTREVDFIYCHLDGLPTFSRHAGCS